jgi:hypothetical protein
MNLKLIGEEVLNIIKWRSRNILIDPFYILKWELYPKINWKNAISIDEKQNLNNPIPVTILTYKRPLYFRETLKTFIEKNKHDFNRFILIILVQGKMDKVTNKIIDKYKNQIYKVIHSENNLGCAGGYSLLMSEALKFNSNFIINLQEDFVSSEPLVQYLPELIHSFNQDDELGYIRLRSISDKVNNYNVISRRKIKYRKISNHIWSGNGHFTFNPTLTKSSIIKKIIPTTSERDAQKKYQKLGLKNGQLMANCFSHIGEERVHTWIK